MNELTLLLCGEHHHLGELSQILEQLGKTIDDFAPRCFKFISENDPQDMTTFAPYCGRTILETAANILIGRLDPFRVLLIKRYQEQANYDPAIRHKIAIQWTGDVLSIDKKPPSLDKISYDKINRALLTDYTAKIYWTPALEKLRDETEHENESEWLNELKEITSTGIVTHFRTEADKLYSSLSKGIHHEFVIPQSAIYDNNTIKELLLSTIALVSKMALVSHYIPTIAARMNDSQKLLDYFKKIEQMGVL